MTRRMPFDQLRSLVVSLVEPAPAPDEDPGDATRGGVHGPTPPVRPPEGGHRTAHLLIDDPAGEFDSRGTTCRGPRTSTLDQPIAFLRKQ